MKAKVLFAATLAMMAWMPMSQAAASLTVRSAGMEVSLRIVESCAIQAVGASGARVSCEHGAPYQIQSTAPQAAAAASSAASAPSHTETATDSDKSPAVVTISF